MEDRPVAWLTLGELGDSMRYPKTLALVERALKLQAEPSE